MMFYNGTLLMLVGLLIYVLIDLIKLERKMKESNKSFKDKLNNHLRETKKPQLRVVK